MSAYDYWVAVGIGFAVGLGAWIIELVLLSGFALVGMWSWPSLLAWSVIIPALVWLVVTLTLVMIGTAAQGV